MPGPNFSGNRVAPTYLFVLLAFAAGIGAERHGWIPGAEDHQPAGLGKTFAPFWEAWHLVDSHYVDRKELDDPKKKMQEKMMRGALQGMLDALGDIGHTSLLTPEQLKQMNDSLAGKFEGIGARIGFQKEQPTVVSTLPGSPAEKAKLRPGDVIVEVDGKEVASMSLSQIVELVRGKPGTVVHLKVRRKSEADLLSFDIRRAEVKVAAVAWRMLPGLPIADIAIREFGDHTDAELKKAIKEAKAKGATGLILDLRGNPGGLKDQAVAVTSEFLKDGTVFIEQDAKGRQTKVPVIEDGAALDIPLVVLIDGGSASSSEIFAGAIQDHKRGKLVGVKTFGTGTVLKPFPLSDGSAILLAVSEWLTPEGRRIWHEGIKPDVEVKLPEGAVVLDPETEPDLDHEALMKSTDKQLLKAIELLQEKKP